MAPTGHVQAVAVRVSEAGSWAVTLMLSSSMGLDRSFTSTWRFRAKEVALLTSPSISAPLKFFVRAAGTAPTSMPQNKTLA